MAATQKGGLANQSMSTSIGTKAGLNALQPDSMITQSLAVDPKPKKIMHKSIFEEKFSDPQMLRYGDVQTLKENRRNGDFKFYDDFTKRFDQSQVKTKLRSQI
jgi:hypothetical protein